tara:strand:- start:74 stop:463 length:390 start_codon:yes stop_codon:yes gene_type:complete
MANDDNDEHDSFDLSLEEYLSDPLSELLELGQSQVLKEKAMGYEVLLSQYIYQLKAMASKIKPSDCYIISGSGPAWYYHPTTRDMIKCERGTEVYPLSDDPDDDGNIMVRSANTYVMVPFDDLIKVGIN